MQVLLRDDRNVFWLVPNTINVVLHIAPECLVGDVFLVMAVQRYDDFANGVFIIPVIGKKKTENQSLTNSGKQN